MNEQPSHPAGFTAAELLVVIETFEVALQTKGFIDITSSGGASPAEETAMLTEMRRVLHKAEALRSQVAADNPTAHFWYVWPLDQDGYKVASPYEVWSATAEGALAQAVEMSATESASATGWEVIRMRTYIGAADEAEPSA